MIGSADSVFKEESQNPFYFILREDLLFIFIDSNCSRNFYIMIAVAYHLKYSISVSGIQSDSQFRVVSAMFAAATHPFL